MNQSIPFVDLSIDGHVHTRLCNHASGELEDYVLVAIERGLREITFLEHLEVAISHPERIWLREEDFDYYFEEGFRLKEKYRDKITVTLGVEAGFNPLAIDRLQEALSRYPVEHRGLSYHFFFNGETHLNMVSRRQENLLALTTVGVDQVLTSYFEGLILGVRELDINVLCHLDAVLRHLPNLHFGDCHWRLIGELLDVMATKDIALEINTSGFAIRGEPYPCHAILSMAAERNISFIAGSDAHRPDQIGRHFAELPQLLRMKKG